MRLLCLGTTGYHPSPSRHTASYYLPEQGLLLDAGTSVFRLVDVLRKEPRKSIDILLSHAHLDHVVGLTFLVDVLAVTELEQIRIHGDPEKLAAVREHLFSPLLFPVLPNFQFMPFTASEGKREIGTAGVNWFPVEHPGGALGFVVKVQGKSLAYVTDTTAQNDADYLSKVSGADLLLHECYFNDDQEELARTTGHSWLSAVKEVVQRIQPKRTLLIHVNPLAETLGEAFFGPEAGLERLGIEIAEENSVVQI